MRRLLRLVRQKFGSESDEAHRKSKRFGGPISHRLIDSDKLKLKLYFPTFWEAMLNCEMVLAFFP